MPCSTWLPLPPEAHVSTSDGPPFTLLFRAQEVHRSLLDSLTSTVELGHNNSLLVVGDRGSGKTLVRATSCSLLTGRHFWGCHPLLVQSSQASTWAVA